MNRPYWDRGVFRIEVPVYLSDMSGSIPSAMAHLQSVLASVPEEFRSGLVFDINNGENGCWVECYYERPITAEELAEHNARVAYENAERDARERSEYERLKAKYGDKE